MLGKIAESIDYGVTASATGQPVGPQFLRITDIQDGAVNWKKVPWCECNERSASEARLKSGDIVFARTGATTGKSFLIRECPSNAVFASYLIRVRFGELVEPRFVSHFFQTPTYWAQITSKSRGVAQPGVNATTLKTLEIPLPPLPEQKRIAEVLDKADELRAKRRAAIDKLDSLTQSIFLEMFGDPLMNPRELPTCTLIEACNRVTDGTHLPPKWAPIGIPFLFISNIVDGQIEFETHKFISEQTYQELTRRCPIEIGDVLYTTVGSYGNSAIVRTAKKFAFQRHIAHIKPNNEKIDSVFLAAMIQSPGVRQQVDKVARGIAQKTVNLSDLKNLVIFCPPLPLQSEFANIVGVMEKLKSSHRASLEKLDAIFASLQDRAFKGEL